MGAAIIGATASTAVASASAATIKEAGSSLVFPLAQIWSKSYTTNTVTTSSVGSGKGINLFQLGQVDIGASDAPMTSSQWGAVKASSPSDTVQIPWALSATGVGYNIPGIKSGLHLNATILAGIFSGTIKTWNNKQIVKLNPNFKKQLGKAGAISPVVRSDGSGDSYAFQHYLTVAAPKNWKYSYSTSWGSPAGTGENGNSGVAGAVKSKPGLDRLHQRLLPDHAEDLDRRGSEPGWQLRAPRPREHHQRGCVELEAHRAGCELHRRLDRKPGEEVQDRVSDLDLHLCDRQLKELEHRSGEGLPDVGDVVHRRPEQGDARWTSRRSLQACRRRFTA